MWDFFIHAHRRVCVCVACLTCVPPPTQRLIDKTRVTCVRWVPGSESQFLVAHASGSMYLYNVDHGCGTTAPHYQLLRQGEGFAVHTCKSKQARNPLQRWTVGHGTLNEFAFSPDGKHLASVSQDGFLRVFGFDGAELYGSMKSYFGGLLCVCWSPDGHYVVAGGEDDLVTVWSFADCRVIARGHGHKSWVSVVAFDQCTTNIGTDGDAPAEFSGSDDDFQDQQHFGGGCRGRERANSAQSHLSKRNSTDGRGLSGSYRFGSVGQDTQLCLWDLTEDILYPLPLSRTRTHTNVMSATTTNPPSSTAGTNGSGSTSSGSGDKTGTSSLAQTNCLSSPLPRSNSLPHSTAPPGGSTPNSHPKASSIIDSALIATGVHKFATLALHESRKERHHDKEHRRNHSVGYIASKSNDKLNQLSGLRSAAGTVAAAGRTLGTGLCPRMEEVPLLEPLVCKKVAHERLTVLIFLDDCLVTACQEGFVCTWARPGKVGSIIASDSTGVLCVCVWVLNIFLFTNSVQTHMIR